MGTVKSVFLKFMGVLTKIELLFAELILVALILVTTIGTLTRYFLSMPFTWIEEFQLACMVWIVFLASCAAFHEKAHVAIEMVVDLFPEGVKRVINVLIGIAVVVILAFVIKTSMAYLDVFVRSGRTTPILKLPYTMVYGIAPVTCVLMVLEYFHGILDDSKDGKDEQGGIT
jgi:TRAP-type C4-dicarboxylate transport system permease small subunit